MEYKGYKIYKANSGSSKMLKSIFARKLDEKYPQFESVINGFGPMAVKAAIAYVQHRIDAECSK